MISQSLREAHWKTLHHEPFCSNQIWGEDWTLLNIARRRHYLLTIIGCFSRYLVAWGIGSSVTLSEGKRPSGRRFRTKGLSGCFFIASCKTAIRTQWTLLLREEQHLLCAWNGKLSPAKSLLL